jgi:hypothetical protein
MTEFLEKIRQEEEIKRIQIGKEVKIIPIWDDMILYLKDPKDSTKILLDLIDIFSKVEEYKNPHTKISSFSICQ